MHNVITHRLADLVQISGTVRMLLIQSSSKLSLASLMNFYMYGDLLLIRIDVIWTVDNQCQQKKKG